MHTPKTYTRPLVGSTPAPSARPRRQTLAATQLSAPLEMHTSLSSSRPRRRVSEEICYTDLSPRCWKDEDCDIILDSLWLFPSRDKRGAHCGDYHGNFIPQIPNQVIRRYTRPREVVVDLFSGSGTTAIEATNIGRHTIGVELRPEVNILASERIRNTPNPHGVRQSLLTADSGSPDTAPIIIQELESWGFTQAHHVILHPPYWDIISFNQENDNRDLSAAASEQAFYQAFARVVETAVRVLTPGRFITLVIGDKYGAGEWSPLGFGCMQVMRDRGLLLKSINVKDIQGNEKGKGSCTNLWKYRAMRGGFYLFKHEYVMIFQKPLNMK